MRIAVLFACLLTATSSANVIGKERPNFLVIVAEDMSPSLGCYGDPDARTPNLDALARRSIRYTQAFSATGVCATSRSAMITGMHPSSIGTQNMRRRIALPEEVRPFPGYLRDAGYFCVNRVKEDFNFETPPGTWDAKTWKEADWTKRGEGQPFFAIYHFPDTHESRLWPEQKTRLVDESELRPEQRHDPDEVVVPEWLPGDDPAVKREWARYQDLVSLMDDQYILPLLRQLERRGVADNTFVFFCSDHGAPFPRAKQWITRAGTQVPLLVHIPEKWRELVGEKTEPGSTNDRLVSLMDLGPTILALAGLEIPEPMEGRPFLGPDSDQSREFLVFGRDRMDERVDFIRAVTDGRFRYVRNYFPQVPAFPWLTYMEKLETSKTFRRMQKASEPGRFEDFLSTTKPTEQLFDTREDPAEVHDLSGDEAHRKTLARMRENLVKWSVATRDTGFLPEQQLLAAEKSAGSIREFAAHDSRYPIRQLVAGDLSLQDANATVRFHAAMQSDDTAGLRRALESEVDSDVRVALAWSLGRSDPSDEGVVAVLTEIIESDHGASRVLALNAVDSLGDLIRSNMPVDLLGRLAGQEETKETVNETWLARRILSRLP